MIFLKFFDHNKIKKIFNKDISRNHYSKFIFLLLMPNYFLINNEKVFLLRPKSYSLFVVPDYLKKIFLKK